MRNSRLVILAVIASAGLALAGCSSTVAARPDTSTTRPRSVIDIPTTIAATPKIVPPTTPGTMSAADYPDCTGARIAGAAPLNRGDPGYRSALDPDGDGIACD